MELLAPIAKRGCRVWDEGMGSHDIKQRYWRAAIMAEASRVVLNGFELRTEIEIVRWPNRYEDDRGIETWTRIMRLLDTIELEEMRLAAE